MCRMGVPAAMRSAAALALVLLLPLVAGCIGGGEGFTAKEARDRAQTRAREWQADAEFIGLGGFETANTTMLQGGLFAGGPDADVGDGRAAAWAVAYRSVAANQSLVVLAFANGTLLADDAQLWDGSASGQVLRWDVDSPRATEVARSHPDVAALLEQDDAGFGLALASPNDVSDPIWQFFAASGQAGRMAQGTINARTGELLQVSVQNMTWSDGPNFEPPEWAEARQYEFSGRVTPGEPEAIETFEVLEAHQVIEFQFNAQGRLPSDRAAWRLLGPDGEELGSTGGFFGNPFFDAGTFETAGPGTYTLEVTYEGDVPGLPVPVQGTEWQAYLQVM